MTQYLGILRYFHAFSVAGCDQDRGSWEPSRALSNRARLRALLVERLRRDLPSPAPPRPGPQKAHWSLREVFGFKTYQLVHRNRSNQPARRKPEIQPPGAQKEPQGDSGPTAPRHTREEEVQEQQKCVTVAKTRTQNTNLISSVVRHEDRCIVV